MIAGAALLSAIPTATWDPTQIAGLIDYWQFDTDVANVGGHMSTATGLFAGTVITFGAGSSANQPVQQTWVAANSVTAGYFDGNDQGKTAAAVLPGSGSYSMLVIFAADDTNARCVLAGGNTSGGTRISQNVATTGKIEDWKAGVGFSTDGNAVTTPLSVIDIEDISATPTSVFYINGVLKTMSSPAAQVSAPAGVMCVGAIANTTFFKGYVYAIAMVTGRISASDIASWIAWSAAKVGV